VPFATNPNLLLRFVNWITFILFASHKSRRSHLFIRWIIFSFPAGCILILAAFSYYNIHQNLTTMVFERSSAISHLSALVLKERLDQIVEVGNSLASRVQFRALIREERWQAAAQILTRIPADFSYIERIVLADPRGRLMWDIPHLSDAVGTDFSYQDWYQGVSREWKPYVSEVYRREAKPQYNIVAAAVPIKDDDGSLLGILLLQVRLDNVFEWSREVNGGTSGFVYFVDHRGHIAAHAKFPAQNDIMDFSSVPIVQKALRGQKGVEITYNPVEKERQLSTYEQIPGYHWAVVAQEPVQVAFAQRDKTLRVLLAVYLLIFAINFVLVCFIKRIFEIVQKHRQRLQENEERLIATVETATDAIVSADKEGRIIAWNKAAETIFGYGREEIIGQPLITLMPQRYQQAHQDGFRRFHETGEAHVIGKIVQLAALKKSGEEFPIELSVSAWKAEGKRFFTAILRDITKHKESEK
jgi:PAS domain S-box-containing protein